MRSLDRHLIFLSSPMAVLSCIIMLGPIGFSKKRYWTMFCGGIFKLVSRVGSQPSGKSLPVSMVKVRKFSIPTIVPCRIFSVLSKGVMLMSSMAHLWQYSNSPLTHLQPALNGCSHVLPSSMYLIASSIRILNSDNQSRHIASQHCIAHRATAHILLRPMGPSAVCLNYCQPIWVENMVLTAIWTTIVIISLFSSSVNVF